LKDEAIALKDELALDQVADHLVRPTDLGKGAGFGSVARSNRLSRSSVEVDSEIRDAIPDVDLAEPRAEIAGEVERAKPGNDTTDDEVKS